MGDEVLDAQGRLHRIDLVDQQERSARVYNFEVRGQGNYFVGNGEVLVHNCDDLPVPRGRASQQLTETLRQVLRRQAGFADEGVPIILDENLAGRGVAQALRDRGFNVRDVREIFGRGDISDPEILSLADTLNGRVLTLDRGQQLEGGFFGRGIQIDARAKSPNSLVRAIKGALQ